MSRKLLAQDMLNQPSGVQFNAVGSHDQTPACQPHPEHPFEMHKTCTHPARLCRRAVRTGYSFIPLPALARSLPLASTLNLTVFLQSVLYLVDRQAASNIPTPPSQIYTYIHKYCHRCSLSKGLSVKFLQVRVPECCSQCARTT